MNILSKIKALIFRHKIISIIILALLIGGGFWAYSFLTGATVQTKYVLAKTEKGTIVSSLSSSGSVSALNTIDIKAKASGDVVYVGVKEGDSVKAGQLLVELNTTDAQKTIRDAESSLLSTQIALQKLEGNSTLAIPKNKQDAIDTLNQDYQSSYNTISNIFTDLPAIMTDLQGIIYGNTFSDNQQNIDYYTYSAYTYDESIILYKTSLTKSYKTASDEYTKNFSDYKSTTRYSDNATIDSIISETYNTTKDIAQAIKDTNNLILFYKDTLTKYNVKTNATADTQLSTINSDANKANSDIISLLNAQNTIKNDKDSVDSSDLDLQSQQLSLTKSENALADAKAAMTNYYVYAPFAGVIAAMNAQVGQTAPSPIATIVTKTFVAEISFGETDIAKIKIGQKSTLTFDAVSDLTITGKVSAIDVVGTSSQGVVSYNVKVVLDIQDDRIKPGMSTTATIITDTKTDALYVPSSAVKTQQGAHYVLKVADTVSDADLQNTAGVILKTAPTRQTVETGLSDDSSTEITSGLSEGDVIVSSTVSSTSTAKTTTSSSSNRGGGMGIPGL